LIVIVKFRILSIQKDFIPNVEVKIFKLLKCEISMFSWSYIPSE
jgi:hypothetical protein